MASLFVAIDGVDSNGNLVRCCRSVVRHCILYSRYDVILYMGTFIL